MTTLPRIFGEAAVGLGLSLGLNDQHIAPECQPSHIALTHGSKEVETPAPPALVPVETNRAERRLLGLSGVVYKPAESIELQELQDNLTAARTLIQSRRNLAQLGRE